MTVLKEEKIREYHDALADILCLSLIEKITAASQEASYLGNNHKVIELEDVIDIIRQHQHEALQSEAQNFTIDARRLYNKPSYIPDADNHLLRVAIAVDNYLESINWPAVGTGRLMDALRPWLSKPVMSYAGDVTGVDSANTMGIPSPALAEQPVELPDYSNEFIRWFGDTFGCAPSCMGIEAKNVWEGWQGALSTKREINIAENHLSNVGSADEK